MRPSTNPIPTVDLDVWRADPKAVAAQGDTALQQAGFLLVTGHGVDATLRAGVRAAARRFFALPDEVKQRYAVRIGGRGWIAPGVEANGLVEGTETPPDLKESFASGRTRRQPADGQYRIGPHTDFGTVTVLDREPGAGGLQVFVTALQDSGQDDPDGPACGRTPCTTRTR